jgi:hypothetical protein
MSMNTHGRFSELGVRLSGGERAGVIRPIRR